MVVVSVPVLNEPDVPDAPLGEELHEALLVDDHEIVVLELYATNVDATESDTVGLVGAAPTVIVTFLLADPPEPVHVTA